jgi:ATP-dependent Zn protease
MSVESLCSHLAPLMPGALDTELEQAHCHCIEFLAGVTAEELFCGGEMLPNTGHDLDAARAVAALICREVADVDAYITLAKAQTRKLLTDHASTVVAIADALIRHRTIDRSQIDTIMRANG